jgi:hypothetical protein
MRAIFGDGFRVVTFQYTHKYKSLLKKPNSSAFMCLANGVIYAPFNNSTSKSNHIVGLGYDGLKFMINL